MATETTTSPDVVDYTRSKPAGGGRLGPENPRKTKSWQMGQDDRKCDDTQVHDVGSVGKT